MEDKKIQTFNYYTSCGFCDERDLHNSKMEIHVSNVNISCICSITIGRITISKTFLNDKYPILTSFVELLNKVDFSKLKTNMEKMMMTDNNSIKIEYTLGKENRNIEYPNNFGLIKLCENFIFDYLIKDFEMKNIILSIINSNSNFNFEIIKSILNNNEIFDIKKDYHLDILANVKDIDFINNSESKNADKVDINELIGKIDNKLKEFE